MNEILVVDDDPDVVKSVRLILEKTGYPILSALNGDDALKVVEAERPVLIMLDLVMPGKSGLEVCRILKSQPRSKNIPVIMFTRSDRDVDEKLTNWAGADAHFNKPVTSGDLLAEVNSWVEKGKSWRFSKRFGMEHDDLTGKKILLEVDPRTDFDKAIEDFVFECNFHGEVTVIVTTKGSALRQALEGNNAVKFIDMNLANLTIFPPILNEYPRGRLNIVFDSLTTLSILSESAYKTTFKFAQNALQVLADRRVTAIFLLNPSAHEPRDVASVRELFTNQLVYDERGLMAQRFTN
jgi:CheY-like chemotaxis protein